MRRSHALRVRLPALLFAGLASFASGLVLATHRVAPAMNVVAFEPASLPVRHATLTLDQAIEIAEKRFHARVVRAGVEESNGQRIYVLRLVSEQGRVWTVRVDSQSGSVF